LSPIAVGLVLVSTFMHAGWNLLAFHRRSEGVFISRMLAVTALVGLAPAAISEYLARSIPSHAWVCVAASGTCCGVYYFCLVRAYGSGDFTIVYPVARALPVLLVAFGDVLLGRQPTPLGWLGMSLVAGGCRLAPLRSMGDMSLRRDLKRSIVWIVRTALGTVGYSLFDKSAADVVLSGPATAARYCYVFCAVSWLAHAVLRAAFETNRRASGRTGWTAPALGTVLNFGAYWLVLWAYQFPGQASYVVAFRQFSIVIGVLVAFSVFKESGRAIRLTGTALILTGLIFIGLWGA